MTRTASTFALAAALLFAGATCRHFQTEALPLYEGDVRPAGEVAKLSGPIAKVDGVKVSRKGSLFALLPGCHIVDLPTTIGEGTTTGAWSVDIGHVSYAIAMKPGYLYVIDAEPEHGNAASVGNATVGGVKITAVERYADGKVAAKLSPVKSRADIEKCEAAGAVLRAVATLAARPDASIAPQAAPSAPVIDGGVDAK